MSRNKTPAKILELSGAYKKNPQRRRESEPETITFKKTAPTYFDDVEKKVWREVLRMIPNGVLSLGDRLVLEQTVLLLVEMRECKIGFSAARHKALMACFSKLGMTPSDRSNVAVPKVKANKFDRGNAKRA